MNGARPAHTEEARLEMYRGAAEEARAEIDEIETYVLSLQARIASLMSRARTLESLVGTVRDLVGPSVELAVPFRPVRIEGLSSPLDLPQRRRDRDRVPAVDDAAVS